MNIFQRRKLLKQINTLDLIPIRRHHHQTEKEGIITLIVPKFEKEWMRKFFIAGRRRKNYHIKLDELGSKTWLAIDGNRTVKAICDAVQEQYDDPVEDIEDRVSKFVSMLYEQRYVTFQQLEEARK